MRIARMPAPAAAIAFKFWAHRMWMLLSIRSARLSETEIDPVAWLRAKARPTPQSDHVRAPLRRVCDNGPPALACRAVAEVSGCGALFGRAAVRGLRPATCPVIEPVLGAGP